MLLCANSGDHGSLQPHRGEEWQETDSILIDTTILRSAYPCSAPAGFHWDRDSISSPVIKPAIVIQY